MKEFKREDSFGYQPEKVVSVKKKGKKSIVLSRACKSVLMACMKSSGQNPV